MARRRPPLSFSLLLLLLLHSLPSSLSLARGPPPPTPVALPHTPPPFPPSRLSYVTIHTHTFTHRDLYQHDGILTMAGTLRETSTSIPLTVLVTHNTPLSTRSLYTAAGLTVTVIPDPGHHDQCESKFNRIHLWSPTLLPYDRVVFLDADLLIVYNLDHTFTCGRFCMTYSSLQHFTDSLLVVHPDAAIHARLLHDYAQLDLGHRLLTSIWCPEESWHFFLAAFGDVEAAPLFDPREGQSDLPLQRLSSSTCLNAMMWYEFFSYRLLRGSVFRNYTDEQGIPAYSLGWTGLKPYNWSVADSLTHVAAHARVCLRLNHLPALCCADVHRAPGLFFNLNWMWHEERDRVLGKSYTGLIAQWVVVALAMWWVGEVGVRWAVAEVMRERKKGERFARLLSPLRTAALTVMATPRTPSPSPLSLPYTWLPRLGVTPLAALLAMAAINLNGWPLYWNIYILTPPHIAYSILCMCHILLTRIDLQLLRYLYHYSPHHPTSSPDERASLLTDDDAPLPLPLPPSHLSHSAYTTAHSSPPTLRLTWWGMLPIVFWEWFTWLCMRSGVYTEFVIKMFAIFPVVAFMYLAHVSVWRAVLQQMKDQLDDMQEGGAGGGGEGGGGGIGADGAMRKPQQRPRGGSAR